MTMERRLGPLAQPYHEGDALRYRRLSRVLTAAGAGLVAVAGRRSRAAAVAGAVLALGGGAAAPLVGLQGRDRVRPRPRLHRRPAAGAPGGARWG